MTMDRVVRAGVSLGMLGLLAAFSRIPLDAGGGDAAQLRLTWRLRGEEAVACRRPTEADLDELPVHMRNPDACLGELPPFELRVEVDGETRVSRVVRPSGVRGDRPLFVYDELRLAPGRHRLAVRFGLLDGVDSAFQALSLDTLVVLDPGRVLLVSRNLAGALEVRPPVR